MLPAAIKRGSIRVALRNSGAGSVYPRDSSAASSWRFGPCSKKVLELSALAVFPLAGVARKCWHPEHPWELRESSRTFGLGQFWGSSRTFRPCDVEHPCRSEAAGLGRINSKLAVSHLADAASEAGTSQDASASWDASLIHEGVLRPPLLRRRQASGSIFLGG